MKVLGFNITRNAAPVPANKQARQASLSRQQLNRIRQDAATRRAAIEEAERDFNPFRVKLQQMYLNTSENGHITGCIERRKDLTLLRKWEFIRPDGRPDEATTSIFCNVIKEQAHNKKWFSELIGHTLDAIYYGYSLIHLGDIVRGDFPNLSSVRRWRVSPDRLIISHYPYNYTGDNFADDPLRPWYVWVPTPSDHGVSTCGYGLFYKLSMYEIFARNLLGFNGDFVELFAAPFRVGTTQKTEGPERDAFEASVRDMANAGYLIKDSLDDTIEFMESSLGGTGYQGYDNFEARLQKAMSTMILGHPDAINSVPGQLGNNNEESPAQLALRDKQSKDGTFVMQVVNNELIPKLRILGFRIPEGVVAVMKNDNEDVDNADNVADLAVKMKQGGLQMDPKYFQTRTTIPVIQQVPTPPAPVTAKLKNLYGK